MQLLVNGNWKELAPPLALAELLEHLAMEPRRVAVELNRQLVPRARFPQTALKDQDHLEIVTLVGGG